MRKEIEGKVSYDRVSDTGYASDFEYRIGNNFVPSLDDVLRYYEGRNVRLVIEVEELPSTEEDEDECDCEDEEDD